jgi:Sec-independent protein translocase protein TatA
MFGLSVWEIAFVLLLALIVLGPRKLPEVAKTLAGLVREAQKYAGQLRSGFHEALKDETHITVVEVVPAKDTESSASHDKPSDVQP